MKSFLFELAEQLHQSQKPLSSYTVIFPNRRASLYFRKHLSSVIQKPVFAPTLITIEDFISQQTKLQVPDKLELILLLHKAYKEVVKSDEPFDQFYFWGEMLLRDFEEIDKYKIDAVQLFKDLSNQREIDSSFDFLTPEQLEFLRGFWQNFDENLSANKKKFLHVWKQLPEVYTTFKLHLKEAGKAYEGMVHREVSDGFTAGDIVLNTSLVFVGFNALTKAEEEILSYCVQHFNAEIKWDADTYYVNNNNQEAGRFFREYQEHKVLGKTFADIPSHFALKKSVHIMGAAQHVGQAKLMAQILQDELHAGIQPEDTLLVLPDEKMMLPVLHGISATDQKLNVTMGFALSSTPLFNMIELLIELQINKRGTAFNHREALALLGHSYSIAADTKVSNEKRKEINKHNRVYIRAEWLQADSALHQLIFKPVNAVDKKSKHALIDYLKAIITAIGSLTTITDIDKEYCFHFLKFLIRLGEILEHDTTTIDTEIPSERVEREQLKSFLRLFRQVVRAEKIPFTGEPLKGLQVMGVLETRNIDFTNVFIISLNEGSLPAGGGKGSYIPYNIRKAYCMPTPEHQDAIYAYLFYRVMQRAENIFLFYNTETDVLGQGEMSRYLQQVMQESGWDIKTRTLHNPIQPHGIKTIVVEKDKTVMDKMRKFSFGRGLHPTTVIDYLECRLRFYLKHVANIREARTVEEDLDARVLGNLVHKVMQFFYEDLIRTSGTTMLDKKMIEHHKQLLPALIDRVFIEAYELDPSKAVEYDGQRLVVREVIKQFCDRIVDKDMAYAPFSIEGIERGELSYQIRVHEGRRVLLKGVIDRIDKKENTIRIIDYKTGKDKVEMKGGIPSLFNRAGEMNKAAFQTLYYAMLYKSNYPYVKVNVSAGLFNRNTIFGDETFGLRLNGVLLNNVASLLPEFELELEKLMQELFNPDQSFDQTTDTNQCKNCPYQTICYR